MVRGRRPQLELVEPVGRSGPGARRPGTARRPGRTAPRRRRASFGPSAGAAAGAAAAPAAAAPPSTRPRRRAAADGHEQRQHAHRVEVAVGARRRGRPPASSVAAPRSVRHTSGSGTRRTPSPTDRTQPASITHRVGRLLQRHASGNDPAPGQHSHRGPAGDHRAHRLPGPVSRSRPRRSDPAGARPRGVGTLRRSSRHCRRRHDGHDGPRHRRDRGRHRLRPGRGRRCRALGGTDEALRQRRRRGARPVDRTGRRDHRSADRDRGSCAAHGHRTRCRRTSRRTARSPTTSPPAPATPPTGPSSLRSRRPGSCCRAAG